MLRTIVYWFCLLGFWFMLAGISPASGAAGAVATLLVLWLNRNLAAEGRGLSTPKIISFLFLGLYLLGQLILAGLQTARLVLSPKLQLQPVLVTFNPGLKSGFLKTVLANSITLTPGTLTVAVEGEKFTVHALNLSAAQKIVQWPLLSLLRGMEEDNG